MFEDMNIQITSPRDPDYHYITVTTEAFVTLMTFHPNVHHPRSLTSSAFTARLPSHLYRDKKLLPGAFFHSRSLGK